MPGFKEKKRLRDEEAALSEALGGAHTFEEWAQTMPQEMRDGFAARALIYKWGDKQQALRTLGFKHHTDRGGMRVAANHKEYDLLCSQVFDTPGVKAILERNLSELEDNRKAIIARQMQIALYSPNDADSTKAATVLSRMAGWHKPGDVIVQQNKQTIYAFMPNAGNRPRVNGKAEVIDALPPADDFLTHEPGGPVRIDSGDEAIDAALEAADD